ncbi:TonB-linked outer membrane protein, SusC/RagA family [Bacteroides luti]|uniref:TonB-linked outer membrane protein, SusC/RagA family n=1 Tax=Bacteroides luti TaxID=1297750 RepID=A0A1M5C722_9BACE|nr:TonB-dependent receptor [Bacteroides luti]SHF50456.1 TonB-linked outer membrane protein, SusC/RagA family [Bacteroides luti]
MSNIKYIIRKCTATGRYLLLLSFLWMQTNVLAQNEQILKGRIVDSKGNPVAGAVINIAEQSSIALSDKDGYFSLKNVKPQDELCVSSVGYLNATSQVNFKEGFQIVLSEDLDEYLHTMPVPFGRKAKKLMTEATSVVTGEELQKHPITILQNAFTATVNGMETYEWSSEPGWSETAMYIRGIRTMNQNARAPLVIVDNVERDLSFLDAFPIENITVLKDAAATAIYGMRGANGAILVTTKRGQAGKTNINFTQEVGYQMLSNKMELQNSYNMALTRNQVRYLSGSDPMYTDEQVEKYRRVSNGETLEGIDRYKYFDTNWFEQLYRDAAPMYKTNMQISGGNNRARYYVSFSYLRQEGMWNKKGTSWNENFDTQHILNRWNLRSNIDIDVTKFLNVSLDLGGRIDNINQPTEGVFALTTFGAVEANPMEPVYCPNGDLYASSTANNPLRYLAASGQEKNRRRNLYSTLSVNGDLSSLLKGLKVNTTVSFDSYETFESTQRNAINTYNYDYTNAAVNDPSEFTYTKYTSYSALTNPSANQREYYYHLNFNAGLNYSNNFGKHAVDARAFVRTYQNVVSGSTSSERTLSFNGQATYAYDNRYILSGNFSRMASDNFAPEERWGNFYGTSLGWVASEESWLKNKNIDLLKLRASYGRAGQSNTGAGRYPYQGTYSSGTGYSFGYSQSNIGGYYESKAGNSNNKWEVSDMLNIGLDFDFWGKKLYGAVDVFKEWRSGILVTRSTIPSMIGVSVSSDSYGKAESKGLEVTLGHRGKIGKVNYYLEGLLTWNTNKITEMDETEPNVEWQRKTGRRIYDGTEVAALYESSFNNTVGGWNIYKFEQWANDPDKVASSQQDAIDHPEKYPYHSASNGKQSLGTAVFKDLNGDRQIDSNDMTPDTYTIIPELIPALNIGLEWNGFDVRAVFNAYLNRSVFLSPAISFSGWSNMGTHEVTKAWGYYNDNPSDPRNINAAYPRPLYGGFNAIDSDRSTGTYKNDIWVKNGNYISLRNVEIGYSLPKELVAKINMTKCRFYFSGYNLYNWSDLPNNVDPEKPMSYCWWYPKTRSFTFGVNIGF